MRCINSGALVGNAIRAAVELTNLMEGQTVCVGTSEQKTFNDSLLHSLKW